MKVDRGERLKRIEVAYRRELTEALREAESSAERRELCATLGAVERFERLRGWGCFRAVSQAQVNQ